MMQKIAFVQQQLALPNKGITNTIQLLDEKCTIPFIARYRKEMTGDFDEVQIAEIAKSSKLYDSIVERKIFIEKSIKEQEKWNPVLAAKLKDLFDLKAIEDFYLPYKRKKTTKAEKARLNGLEPLAKMIMAQNGHSYHKIAEKYLNKNIENTEQAIEGAQHIISEWINEHIGVRNALRQYFHRNGLVSSKAKKDIESKDNAIKYKDYFSFSEPIRKIASHRLLAILRAEKEGFVKVKLEIDKIEAIDLIRRKILKAPNEAIPFIKVAIDDAYKRLLFPALELELISEQKEKADKQSIKVFANNLKQLLLMPPLGEKRILAIDPGFRSGCKVVCLDQNGNLLHNETIYPHAPQNDKVKALKKISSLINSYQIEAISIGNGTASRETEHFIKRLKLNKDIQVFVVNEAGASVYSASKIARDEFPTYDVTVRGSVSIGRRLSDPLAELVKIDPKSIGVGQYQHDVNQNLLKEELDLVVSHCVNHVGINLNTASKSLLSYVSGLGDKMAENIVALREKEGGFKERKDLKKVPRLGEKAFEQCAGFLRIKNGKNPLDDTAVHPERYTLIKQIAKSLNVSIETLLEQKDLLKNLNLDSFVNDSIAKSTLQDIVKELEKSGLDPRSKIKLFEFDENLKNIDDVKEGMIVPGIINNITNFGCFVDIGIKESGLIHISNLTKEFISDVNDVVTLGQHLKVKVIEIDKDRKRIALSLLF